MAEELADLGVADPDEVDWNLPASDSVLYLVRGESTKGAGLLENLAPAEKSKLVLLFTNERRNRRITSYD